ALANPVGQKFAERHKVAMLLVQVVQFKPDKRGVRFKRPPSLHAITSKLFLRAFTLRLNLGNLFNPMNQIPKPDF
ncbi:MAG: hypothetical protein KGS48_11680, partial [Bacteroidetes bacterium]|nr:hypothetical protein [Bacteroidota bacterium]